MSTAAAPSSTGTRKCYHCGLAGHMAKDCSQAPKKDNNKSAPSSAPAPSPAAPTPSSSSSAFGASESASSGTRKCYNCGQAGHMGKDCPQPAKASTTSASASSSSSTFTKKADKEEKSFKERLAEYKAANPNPVKKNFCYLCGIEGHRERDCPKNSKKADEPKLCLRCGEPDHIARVCPTIANRTVYRQETKERTKGCYICSEEGHHAEECKELEVLAEEFPKFQSKLQSGLKLNVKVYNILLTKCARALELNGALWLYQELLSHQITPTDDTYAQLSYLYDRSGRDHSKLEGIPQLKKRVQMLRDIVTKYRMSKKVEETSEGSMKSILEYLKSQKDVREEAQKQSSLFDLAKYLKKVSETKKIPGLSGQTLSANDARLVLSAMKTLGRYHQKSKAAEFDLEGDDMTQPGKWHKKDEETSATAASSNGDAKKGETATSKKKKAKAKKAASAKKKEAKESKKRKLEEEKENGDENAAEEEDGEEESEEKPASAKASSKKKKSSKTDEDGDVEMKEEKKSSTKKKAASANDEQPKKKKTKTKQ